MTLLETTTSEGALKGMVTARAPHELQEQEVAYLQDAIVNQPGFVNRRGAITPTTAITAANVDSSRIAASCIVTDPAGVTKIGLVYWKDTGSKYEYWIAVFDTSFNFIQKHFLWAPVSGGSTSYPSRVGFVQCTPAMDGSVIISIRHLYNRITPYINTSRTIRWYGGCPATSIGGLPSLFATVASTEGSTSVTGGAAEIAKISFPGMIVVTLGVVAQITSTTQVELMFPADHTVAASPFNYFMAEGMATARSRGKISCTAGVLTPVVGYGTKFTERNDYGINTPSAGFIYLDLATMKSLAHLTTNVIAATSDTTSGVPTSVPRSASMKNYLAYSSYNANDAGFNRFNDSRNGQLTTPSAAKGSFWAPYKGYLVSFNALVEQPQTSGTIFAAGDLNTTSRAYIHGPRFPDIMDHSVADGDWFDVTSTKHGDPDGIAVQGGSDSVILCKGQETFAMTGDDPDNFTYDKISDDGALTYQATTSWKGLPIWLGRTGVWMYDGSSCVNLLDNSLGSRYTKLVTSFDGTSVAQAADGASMLSQARCFVYRDYLFVNITNTGNQHVVYTDGVARTSQTMQFMIYLPTLAFSFLSNFNWSTFFQYKNAGYVVLPQQGSVNNYFFAVDGLFDQGFATTDDILTLGSYSSGSVPTSVGPWFHIESRKYDIGDGLRRKTWKQLSIESLIANTKRLFLETVAGLNSTGVRAATPYTGTGVWKAAKIRFNDRGQYMSFRIYEDINNRPATMQLGAWQWGYKVARRGQV